MLQKHLFLNIADKHKNYSEEELELSSIRGPYLYLHSSVLAICLVISILGLIGNGSIIYLLCCIIKKTKFTVYVANMATGDFLTQFRAFMAFFEYFTPLSMNTHVTRLMLVIFFFGQETSSYILGAMSIERCLTVFSPVWYHAHRQNCSTALICALFWTMSVTLSALEHFLCTHKYVSALNIGHLPCQVETILQHIIIFLILIPCMIFSILALCIRMKIKPQQDFPARLDISIWITVALNLIFFQIGESISMFIFLIPIRYHLSLYYFIFICYFIGGCVNPFVYLLVGCWKRKKDQEPFYMFLERALKDERKGSIRTQPGQEQA